MVTACDATPEPDTEIVIGEFDALLVTVMLPVTLPTAAGVKVTFRVTACPGVIVSPVDKPLAAMPGPEITTFVIEILAAPVLVNVTGRVLVPPTLTLLKFMVEGLAFRAPGLALLTVSVAALLVTLPAELLTTTVKCSPLCDVIVAGVV
jgi:hypothetical protein